MDLTADTYPSRTGRPARGAAASGRDWTITLPRTAPMVPVVRAFTRAILGICPRSQDAETIISQHASNMVRYGAPGGGVMHVTVATVRVEVTDPGPATAPTTPAPPPAGHDDDNGRGFLIIDALADHWGHYGTGGGPLTAWAELHNPGGQTGCCPAGEA